ncbi:hypothetical protein GCM10027418_06580 [Mariniluteicoccus endophyticus]
MLTYPVPASAYNGGMTAAEVLAFLKSPTLLARRFDEIVAARNFLSHYVLQGRYIMQGGALVYFPDEATEAKDGPETVAPGAEYPLITLDRDQMQIVAAMKKGFGTEYTDEEVGRLLLDPVERGNALMANKMVSTFDALAMGVVQSAITQTLAGGSWSSAAQIIADVEAAKAAIRSLKLGYTATAVVLTGPQWAKVAAPLVSVLPREAGNPVVSGGVPNILGLNWVVSDDLPAGWVPTVIDVDNLGGIGHENVPSPEYRQLSAANGSNIEVASYREKYDSTRVQIRKCDVPVVRNPKAGIEITGTTL